MNPYPHKNHVYLAGAMEGVTLQQAKEWRDEAKWKFALKNIDVLDPTRRLFFNKDPSPHASARLFKCDLQDISNSSVILANLCDSIPARKWGTLFEVAHAHTKHKIIIVILDKDQWVHPFISQYATEIHYSVHDAVDAAMEYFI